MNDIYYHYMHSPIGKLLLAGDSEYLSLLGFPEGKMRRRHETNWIKSSKPFKEVERQLLAYFNGRLKSFDVPLAPEGTDFQLSVWRALQKIPYGTTCNYGELAKAIGSPKASRAVGAANGVNPIPVIIPCHRVIGSTGKLTGFGGGLEAKAYLLELESGAIV